MVDIGVSASGESTRRKMDSFVDSAVEVVPLDLYDSFRAKIAANLQWIFAKAYGVDNVPEELKDPFYIDQYEQEHIKPPVLKLLLSSELYCRVCGLILKGDQVAALQGHQPVIEALSQKGIYVMESEDTPVSEVDLSCAPIKMSAHMSMIDALMMAYTVEMISIEKVVASVKRFSTFSASKELPYDLEDAMVFWINKVNLKMREILEKEQRLKQQIIESPSHQKVRYRRDHPSNRHLPYFPLLEDLMKDISDGAALLTVIHFYCPEQMKLDDICLKEVPSMADNLYNIQLLKEFSSEYLNKCFYLTLEDMLYSPQVLKPNFMVFIAELFWWFENVKPDFVQPRDTQEAKEAKSVLPHKSGRPQIPISNATKRSFMASPSTAVDSYSETRSYLQPEEAENGKGSTAFSPSHPLLPLRQKQQKTVHTDESPGHRDCANSLTQADVPPRSLMVAWGEKRPRPLSQPPFALHCADDVDVTSGDSISLARSISKDSLASNIINATPKHHLPTSSVPVNSRSLLGHVDIEDEEEELVAFIRSGDAPNQGDLEVQSFSSRTSSQQATARSPRRPQSDVEKTDGFFLEPLMPAVLKPAKEKQIVHKRDEYGEGKPKGFVHRRENEGTTQTFPRKKITTNHTAHSLNRTYTPVCSSEFPATQSPRIEPLQASLESATGPFRPLATSSIDPSVQPSSGFFLHDSNSDIVDESKLSHLLDKVRDPEGTWTLSRQDSDSDNLELEDECDQELPSPQPVCKFIGEEESAKLQEDMKVKENDDKDDASGRSSPCLSTISQVSSVSMASGSVRMTSFAERKFQRLNSYETKSSTSSSQKTTPDGSECCPPPLTTWKQRREQSPGGQNKDNVNVLASELIQLHMQLEEKRRAIEAQKKKMESLSARQRLKLGKAAFLRVVKKSKYEGTSHPLRPEHSLKDFTRQIVDDAEAVTIASKAEQVLEKVDFQSELSKQPKVQEVLEQKPKEIDLEEGEVCNVIADASPDDVESEVDVNECNLSIEKLNETISTLQQAILKISQQQELLMKAPASVLPALKNNQDLKLNPPVHFVEPLSPPGASTGPRKNRFGPSRTPRSSRASEHKMSKEKMQNSSRFITPTQSIETLPHLKTVPALKSPMGPLGDVASGKAEEQSDGHPDKSSVGFRLHEENNQKTFVLSTSKDANIISDQAQKDAAILRVTCTGSSESSGKENVPIDEQLKSKSSLIEVDLSEIKDEEGETDNPDKSTDIISEDQKSGVGFFFKDEQKAEDELAKKRAAFLLKQQKKAEEARLRKQQLEAEVELKRDEARRKAEEERIRKDEEKARRELIKQEYLRRKQQQILEEQGLGRPKPRPKPKKSRPKSVHREESYSDSGTKYSSTPDNLSSAQSGSSLSLASGATTEAESVHSGGTPSHRVDSVEALSLGSRHQNRNAERDWENASTASSIASVAEYSGPKLYKEPSSKSNKPIIHNAISHCCLAGKVNESQKNQTLDELEKSDSNHYIILFRDAGCQFRALYSYHPDSEEICKLTGTGPKSISKKMIDKLYKYSSDRKQFTVIPAKTMSVSVDAVTIHNNLWQAKRPGLAKKNPLYK